MRKLIFGLMAILAMSCSKDNENNIKDDTLYNIEFKVSNFSTEIVPMTKIGQIYDTVFSYILYVFDENKEAVYKNEVINNYDSIHHSFYLQLPKGNYEVVAIGFSDWLTDTLSISYNTYMKDYSVVAKRSNNPLYYDYFYKKTSIQVNDDMSENMQLSRATGRVELNITDIEKISNYYDFDKVEIVADSIGYGIHMRAGSYYTHNVVALNLTKNSWLNYKNRPIVINGMQGGDPKLNIILKKGNNVVKDFTGVIPRFGVYSNKKTIITGKLMPDITDNGFNLSFDTSWGEPNNVNF